MNINVFLFFSFVFLQIERERVYKIWYKETQSQGYLSYFSTGFHWRIFLLLWANRLYAIFNTGLKNLGPSCPRYFLSSSTRNTGFGSSARYEPCPTTNFLIIYFRGREGVPTSVLGSQPIIWLLSSSPWSGDFFFLGLLDVTQVPFFFHQVTQYKHLFFPFWPGFVTLGLAYILSCFNGHSLKACYC